MVPAALVLLALPRGYYPRASRSRGFAGNSWAGRTSSFPAGFGVNQAMLLPPNYSSVRRGWLVIRSELKWSHEYIDVPIWRGSAVLRRSDGRPAAAGVCPEAGRSCTAANRAANRRCRGGGYLAVEGLPERQVRI